MFWWRRKQREQDLERELRLDLELEAEDQQEKGLSPEEARYAARKALGNATRVKEDMREAWGWTWLERFAQDVRYGLRLLRKSPGFTSVAVLSVALGIGANTAVFSLIDAVLLKFLPIKDPKGLVFLATEDQADANATSTNFYFGTYQHLRAEQPFFRELAGFSPVRLNVSVNGESEPSVEGQLVSGNYFAVLGVGAATGRTFTDEDDRIPDGHPVAVISYEYWRRRFGVSHSVVGQKLLIDGTPFTIIGVTPPGFRGLEVGSAPDISVPLMMQPVVMPDKENWLIQSSNIVDWLKIFGRLKPGVTADQAASGMRVIYGRIQKQLAADLNPQWQHTWLKGWAEARLLLVPGGAGVSDLRMQFNKPLFLLMGVVGLVLLIACANVANLQLGRASARRREIGVRLAIGAGRLRLIRQLLVESVLVSCMGGSLGILCAFWGTRLLVHFISIGRTPIVLELDPDFRVLAFTAIASIATGVLFGLAPALRATQLDLIPALKEDSHSTSQHQRLGKILASAQMAISLVLIIGASLLVGSLRKLNVLDAGFQRDRLLTVRLEPRGSDQKRGTNALRLNRLYLSLQERIQAIPEVTAVSLANSNPTSPLQVLAYATADGRQFRAARGHVFPRYFETVGGHILRGRDFDGHDVEPSAPLVVVVNETLARNVFPGVDPIGKRIICNSGDECEVIGVATDIPYSNLRGRIGNAIYYTFLQAPTGRGQMVLHVRVAGDPVRMAADVRREVARIDSNLPAFEVRTLATEIDAVLVRERLLALLSSAFGALALLLAALGLYGVIAYAVGRRTKEFGIRIALGATRSEVRLDVLWETMRVTGVGILFGLPMALGTTRFIASFVFGLTATDPTVLSASLLFLCVIALISGYLPARRASQVDPMVALRYE